jgi:type I restriction enzyme M protein
MLDTDTKRRIDTARDILVGKVPDPKSQVEQITIALIYKFMDDMDAESEEMGGARKFFTGDFARYGWAKLMSAGIGGHELIGLYGEGISTMPQNAGIPPLFREIFKNAYLPYRDPETLKSFLKIIDEFSYDHSERLGDAFEYLLSVLGSQGDAGQFRTPRHIIDFMVAIIDPKKNETVLDPACGTAGFLISSWKHILKANTDAKGNSTLTPDEKGGLAKNFKGYDISPDMVRLSLVNLYLHGFTDPHIYEYDSLTSEDRWNEYADVILANPPFMSPKGGIKPHKRFSIQASRSEVLFVDYMAEHLTPIGRAGIIVPEGIIFQSQTAYKDLRRMLVENSLVAVISLPAGVFQPYSGVKTSILILDKSLAKQSNSVAFFKVENDGFGLGAQRRANAGEQLTQVQLELAEYLQLLRNNQATDELQATLGLIVPKEKIAANDDYNLSVERYRENGIRASNYPLVAIQEVAEVASGFGFPLEEQGKLNHLIPFLKVSDMNLVGNEIYISSWNHTVSRDTIRQLGAKTFPKGTVIFPKIGAAIATNKKRILSCESTYDNNVMGIVPGKLIASEFLYALLQEFDLSNWASDSQPPSMRKSVVEAHKFPLPPMDVQMEIVAEIEGYQKIINGARAVLDNYRPQIPIQPDWPMVEIGEICDLINGRAFKPTDWEGQESGGLPIVRIQNLNNHDAPLNYYTGAVAPQHLVEPNELLFSWSGSRGTSFGAHIWWGKRAVLNQHIFKVHFPSDRAVKGFLLHILNAAVEEVEDNLHGGVGLVHITKGNLERIKIPLPPLTTQQAVVTEIETEQALVAANRKLIARFEKKIQTTLARIWGEEEQPQMKA